MTEAEQSDPSSYNTFNEFFTRSLRAGVRVPASAKLVCPVDGQISQFGGIEDGQLLQAKGRTFTVAALLAGNERLAGKFHGGKFATIYLSPGDYHRIHMPCDGQLLSMTYVPGEFFSVNPVTARSVDGLFARNERVVCEFASPDGPFVLVLVGAAIVGSIATSWHGVIQRDPTRRTKHWDYLDRPLQLAQGEEMGRFMLGSTVILLFPPGSLRFNEEWKVGRSVRLSEKMAD